MKYLLPQEIQVWYILPVIRREFSRILVKEKGFTQKETAKMLSLTEGAVSQYLSSKRGNAVKFSDKIIKEVEISAERISKDPKVVLKETLRILSLDDVWRIVCEYHKNNDPHVTDGCNICSDYRKKFHDNCNCGDK